MLLYENYIRFGNVNHQQWLLAILETLLIKLQIKYLAIEAA